MNSQRERSAISPEAADPLAEARCLKCGYSLRGLPENRCPECGTPFDPADLVNTLTLEWPRLMTWYIAACAVSAALDLTGTGVFRLSALARGAFASVWDALSWFPLPIVASLAVISLAIPAVVGLRRRVDWGRKASVILLLTVASVWLVHETSNAIHALKLTAAPAGRTDYRLVALTQAAGTLTATVAPSVVLAGILLTGLRCRSLRRSAGDPHVRLPLSRLHLRGDWLLLMVILLATHAATCLGNVVQYCGVCLSGDPGARWCFCNLAAELLVGLGFAAGAQIVRKHPSRTSCTLRNLFGLSLVLELALTVLYALHLRSLVPSTLWEAILGWGLTTVGRLVVPATLYIYASRALPVEAIERVAIAKAYLTHQPARHGGDKHPDDGKVEG